MRRILPLATVLVLATVLAAVAGAKPGTSFPERIALPNAFQPEGIAIAGDRFYVGSIPTGAIYAGSLRTGAGDILVPARTGRAAIGLDVERGLLFVAGGPTGKGFVYDARSGADVAEYTFTTGRTFVNDVVVTRDAAWFTDSQQPVLYRVPLSRNGRPGPQSAVETVPLTGDFAPAPGFNLNGIDATPNGKTLVVVQSNLGRLFTVDAATGVTHAIDLGGESVPNGDGILLDGRTLFVVQNQRNLIAEIRLAPDLESGRVVRRIGGDFAIPTTIAEHGNRLYAVNARFGTPATPLTAYWVTQVRK